MANKEFSDVVLRLVASFANKHINTSMPAKVINTDNLDRDQTVDVLPMINNAFDDGTALEYPPILDVPVIFPSAGGGLLSFPIAVDDTILLVFSQKSLDEWMESRSFGNVGFTPSDKRTYSLNDAIAFPGLYTKKNNLQPNTTDVELKFNGMSITLQESGSLSIDNTPAGNSVVLDSGGDVIITAGSSIITAGNSGDINATNGTSSLDLLASGAALLTGSGGSVGIAAGGGITMTTGTGSMDVNTDGSMDFGNGASITSSGDFVTASGRSLDGHVHNGSPTAPNGPVSNTGTPV